MADIITMRQYDLISPRVSNRTLNELNHSMSLGALRRQWPATRCDGVVSIDIIKDRVLIGITVGVSAGNYIAFNKHVKLFLVMIDEAMRSGKERIVLSDNTEDRIKMYSCDGFMCLSIKPKDEPWLGVSISATQLKEIARFIRDHRTG